MNENNKNKSTLFSYQCPVCGKTFQDIHSYAAHVTEHSEKEKKLKAEQEQKQREEKRKEEIDKIEFAYAEKVAAEKRFQKAVDEYREKYGGLVFPYKSISPSLFSFINEIF